VFVSHYVLSPVPEPFLGVLQECFMFHVLTYPTIGFSSCPSYCNTEIVFSN